MVKPKASDNPIRRAREKKGFLQKDVAKYLGVSQPAMSLWESGYSMPHPKMLLALADLYEYTVDELLGRESAAAAQQ